MNKWIIGGTLVATSLMAHAETFSVRFATPMTAGKKNVPAGDYTLATLKGNPGILLLESKTLRMFVFGRMVEATPYEKPIVELDNVKPATPTEGVKLAAAK